MNARTRAYLLLGLASAIWGFTFVAQRLGADHMGAASFNAARGLLGALVLLPLVWFGDRRAHRTPAQRRDAWRAVAAPGAAIGCFFFGGSMLQQLGIEQTTAGNAAFVTGLYMVFVPLVGLLVGQRAGGWTWWGLALAVPGLFLLTWTGVGIGVGDLLVLAGTLFWTAHILGIGRWARHVDPLRLSVAQFLVLTVLSAAAACVFEPTPFGGLTEALGAVLFAGVLSTGIGFTLQVVAQRDAKASVAALIMALESLWGAVGGALLLGERLTPAGVAGAVLMMAGILVAQVPTRAERRREASGGDGLVPEPEPPSTALREG